MIRYTKGNLLESGADALVNTVNTVGVMGKGIALMFKDAFPENFRLYAEACKRGELRIGCMFVTEQERLGGPRLIVNFPTKEHWRRPSQMGWIERGLLDLRRVIEDRLITSIAIPPLGSGQGGLDWRDVRSRIEASLASLRDVDVIIYEPTAEYQNVAKRAGLEKLTPARALIAEMIRRYWVLGFECSLLEVQKLAWFLERSIARAGLEDILKLDFAADRYGPYSDRLRHLLNGLDGSYLHCDKRINDAKPLDVIRFDDAKTDRIAAFLTTAEAKPYRDPLETTDKLIDGFQSPLGMELLATVDWLLRREQVEASVPAVHEALSRWPGQGAGERKSRLFDTRLIGLALQRLLPSP